MTFTIALNFEDGITRFIQCHAGEKVLDAAYRQKVNLPMDCSDGVCGTCKCKAESGTYDLGDDFIDEALTQDEAGQGLVLTCQMKPTSDCVISIPVPSTACKTGMAKFGGSVAAVRPFHDAAYELELAVAEDTPAFLPGQYVNIGVPGSGQHRSYSFSSHSGEQRMTFLIKHVPGGLMSSWLAEAQPGAALEMIGPLGSFYLRDIKRPLLMLAGGTGLAPFTAMLEKIAEQGSAFPIHLIYGVTHDADLVDLDKLDAFKAQIPNFTWAACVASPDSTYPNKGYVTNHIQPAQLNAGEVDIYLCGPPPMVEAVNQYMRNQGIKPANFYHEKFSASA